MWFKEHWVTVGSFSQKLIKVFIVCYYCTNIECHYTHSGILELLLVSFHSMCRNMCCGTFDEWCIEAHIHIIYMYDIWNKMLWTASVHLASPHIVSVECSGLYPPRKSTVSILWSGTHTANSVICTDTLTMRLYECEPHLIGCWV